VIDALSKYDDPRIDSALAAIVRQTFQRDDEWSPARPIAPALRLLARRASTMLPTLVVTVFRKAKVKGWWAAEDAAARAGSLYGVSALVPLLLVRARTLTKWSSSDVSAALARLAPKDAFPVLARLFCAEQSAPEWGDFDAGQRGAALAGLLPLRPNDATYRHAARAILARKYDGNDTSYMHQAVRGVLLALETVRIPELDALVKRWTRYDNPDDEETPPYETIAELAQKVLAPTTPSPRA
jgi:hypothetical protein